ncbi:MAG: hypothetical protein IKN49_00040 [Elusimicrobiaceae bacterium]|nr:hypothetical protein [Elusimicrobiaceae bacterium]
MSISVVKQYSVFLINEPGSLKNFTQLFSHENVNILGISSDVRFDAAVVRVAVKYNDEIGHALTKAGFTNVKVNAICVDTPERLGVIRDISDVLQKQNLNITSIYGAGTHNGRARFIIVVNNITQALSALESSGLF